jgi:hypothetical protein
MEIEILFVNEERSFNEIAIVLIRYYEVLLRCKLVVGFNEKTNSIFYYVLLPYISAPAKVKEKKGRRQKIRVNVVSWPNEQISKQFQAKSLELLRDKNPELFSLSEETVKTYLSERSNSILKRSKKPQERSKNTNSNEHYEHTTKELSNALNNEPNKRERSNVANNQLNHEEKHHVANRHNRLKVS